MPRDSMLMYRSFFISMAELPGDQYKHLMMSMASYALDGEETELLGMERALFVLMKPQLDANEARYQNSKKGGRKPHDKPNASEGEPKQTKPSKHQTKPKPNTNQNETKPLPNASVSVSVSASEKEKSAADASPPFSLQDELNPNRKDVTSRIEIARRRCVELGSPLASSAKKLMTRFSPEREAEIYATLASFTDADIDQAQVNIARIFANPTTYRRPTFSRFDGFLATGVEQFVDAADPFTTYRIQPRAHDPEKVPSVYVPDAETTRMEREAVRAVETGDAAAVIDEWARAHPDSPLVRGRAGGG